jgi:hypothetical protein
VREWIAPALTSPDLVLRIGTLALAVGAACGLSLHAKITNGTSVDLSVSLLGPVSLHNLGAVRAHPIFCSVPRGADSNADARKLCGRYGPRAQRGADASFES